MHGHAHLKSTPPLPQRLCIKPSYDATLADCGQEEMRRSICEPINSSTERLVIFGSDILIGADNMQLPCAFTGGPGSAGQIEEVIQQQLQQVASTPWKQYV